MDGTENFGFEANVSGETAANLQEKTDLDTGSVGTDGKTNLDDNKPSGDVKPEGEVNKEPKEEPKEDPANETSNLSEGDIVEVGDESYTVDANGNLLDKDGNVFKTAEELKDFIESSEVIENNKPAEIDMASVLKEVGIDVLDEEGKPVEFENTPTGVASYVNSVLDLKREEYAQAGINKLIQDFPIVSDVLNYYVANGNSLEGFESMPDRSNVVIDEQNAAQQEAIVRQASKEFGRRTDDNFIQYLKDSGKLLEAAKADLAALQEADNEIRKQNAERAAAIQAEEDAAAMQYWTGVKNIVDSREIAGYKIPETIIIEKDGRKTSATPDDFFNYIYQVDDEGYSRYQRELANESPENRMNDELLKAWLKYTGKTYDSLVEMAVAKKEVKRLKLAAAKNKTTRQTIKITKSNSKGSIPDNETFGM